MFNPLPKFLQGGKRDFSNTTDDYYNYLYNQEHDTRLSFDNMYVKPSKKVFNKINTGEYDQETLDYWKQNQLNQINYLTKLNSQKEDQFQLKNLEQRKKYVESKNYPEDLSIEDFDFTPLNPYTMSEQKLANYLDRVDKSGSGITALYPKRFEYAKGYTPPNKYFNVPLSVKQQYNVGEISNQNEKTNLSLDNYFWENKQDDNSLSHRLKLQEEKNLEREKEKQKIELEQANKITPEVQKAYEAATNAPAYTGDFSQYGILTPYMTAEQMVENEKTGTDWNNRTWGRETPKLKGLKVGNLEFGNTVKDRNLAAMQSDFLGEPNKLMNKRVTVDDEGSKIDFEYIHGPAGPRRRGVSEVYTYPDSGVQEITIYSPNNDVNTFNNKVEIKDPFLENNKAANTEQNVVATNTGGVGQNVSQGTNLTQNVVTGNQNNNINSDVTNVSSVTDVQNTGTTSNQVVNKNADGTTTVTNPNTGDKATATTFDKNGKVTNISTGVNNIASATNVNQNNNTNISEAMKSNNPYLPPVTDEDIKGIIPKPLGKVFDMQAFEKNLELGLSNTGNINTANTLTDVAALEKEMNDAVGKPEFAEKEKRYLDAISKMYDQNTADQTVDTSNQTASNPITNNPISTTGNYVPDLLNPKQKSSSFNVEPFSKTGIIGNIQSNQPRTNPQSFPNPNTSGIISDLQSMYPSYDYSGPDQQTTTEPKSTQQIMQEKLFPEKFKSETGIVPDVTNMFDMLDNSGFYNQKLGMEFNKPFMPGTENVDNTIPEKQVTSDGKITTKGTVKPPKQPGAKGDSKFSPKDYYLAKGLMDTVALFNNMIQPPPPGIAMKLPHSERMRLDRTPYELQRTLAKEAQTQSNRAMREGMSQASDMMKANAASQGVTQDQLRQVGGQEAQAMQSVDQMNQQIANQENMAQTELLNKEAVTNYEIQARAKEAKDANINKQLEQIGNTMGAYAQYMHSKEMSDKITKNYKQQADMSNRLQLAMLEHEMTQKELGSDVYKEAEKKVVNDYIKANKINLLKDPKYSKIVSKYGEDYDPTTIANREQQYQNFKTYNEQLSKKYGDFKKAPDAPTPIVRVANEKDEDWAAREKQYQTDVTNYQYDVKEYNDAKAIYDKNVTDVNEMKELLDEEKKFEQDIMGSYNIADEKKKFQSSYLKERGLPESKDILETVRSMIESYRQM